MNEPEEKDLRFARECLVREFDHRREHIWKIFSWVSNLFIAITGAVIALTAQDSFTMTATHRGLLTGITVVILFQSLFWIWSQSHCQRNVEAVLEEYDHQLSVKHQPENARMPPLSDSVAYLITLLFLSVTVLLTVWIVPN